MSIFSNLFGDYSHREIKRIQPLVRATLALEEEYSRLSDDELKAKTPQFKERLANGETLDDLLPEAFATCREAAWRILEMKHFPVQVEGGIILHQGRVAEMKTGEGKTLVATLPAYLNALTGNGVHVVTVNDYLARRDSEWMGKVYRFLGLSVGLVINERNPAAHKEAYAADITYGTNNEMGFDYLRDNMVTDKADRVQRGHNFAIVDEVDSILIDEARTPLIISGMSDKSTDLYRQADDFVSTLKMTKVKEIEEKVNAEDLAADGDYIVDEKARTASLTKRGIEKAEKHFGVENLMDSENLLLQHHIDIAVKAHGVMHRDTDYIVKDGEVLIVDEFTGRIMIGRRYNDGLHQAIEAKEHVEVNRESKTVATITLQNYFRLYSKLSGMTGTAMTEQEEFQEIYSLDCVEIPTNKPMIRVDHPDVMYKKEGTKLNAIVQQIKQCHEKGQPVLVGTVSIEKSEHLSKILRKEGVPHQVLNAKNHEKEAEIIAQAGKVGAVTIATNMAGRGTDIILGGNAEFLALSDLRRRQLPEELIAEANAFGDTDNEEILEARRLFRELEAKHKAELSDEADRVREAGGLFIIGTERQESRRVDNQLRGRAGRQGDPGESRFYISAEDDLVRLFAGDRFYRILDSFKSMEETPIDIKMFSQTIESAQKRREGTNFAIRKNVLKYDDVMNQQRTLIYDQRNEVLDGERPIGDIINDMIERSISDNVDFYLPANLKAADRNTEGLIKKYAILLPDGVLPGGGDREAVRAELIDRAKKIIAEKDEKYGADVMTAVKRDLLLRNVDLRWMDHIDDMDQLQRGIGLRAYAQQDPILAFREESFDMFEEMRHNILEGTVDSLLRVVVASPEQQEQQRKQRAERARMKLSYNGGGGGAPVKKQPVKAAKKPGRNDPCPCGSGKKYKYCHGRDE